MNKYHVSPEQLAANWGMHPGTLANWRVQGKGPKFVKVGRKIWYKLEDIAAYERSRTVSSTAELEALLA